jgi:hypothetical protein
VVLENDLYRLAFDPLTGALTSFFIKPLGEDLIGEKRLAALFRLRLQHPDYECDYSTATQRATVSRDGNCVRINVSQVNTGRGDFPVRIAIVVALEDGMVKFRSRLENGSGVPLAEFWFPRLGGITRFGDPADTELFWPGYDGPYYTKHLQEFGCSGFMSMAVMMCLNYPWPTMPWFDLYNKKIDRGLYFGYHDPLYRINANGFEYSVEGLPDKRWPTPADTGTDDPIGLTYSHIRFPYVGGENSKAGDTLDSGEFVIAWHEGDWHDAAPIYRQWWDRHFSVPAEPTWLRKRTCWYACMLMQQPDLINADFQTFARWSREAKELGIDTVEICGWDTGGQDRAYPDYTPEERLGGEKGFQRLLDELKQSGIDPILFANYNAINCETDWFKRELRDYMRMDEFGNSENWMAWGYSHLVGNQRLSVRRQVWASGSIPRFNEIIAGYFRKFAAWGARAVQIDKTGSAEQLLDFNPLSELPPDTSMAEGTVRSCEWLLKECKKIQPDFVFASEANSDRYLQHMDVYYRGASHTAVPPMRYVFPEWTPAMHLITPHDFLGINNAVRFGVVIVLDMGYNKAPSHPRYRAITAYLKEINRLRAVLLEDIFWSRWLDCRGAELIWKGQIIRDGKISVRNTRGEGMAAGGIVMFADESANTAGPLPLQYSVHERFDNHRRALVVVNSGNQEERYQWRFTPMAVQAATLYAPFEKPRLVSAADEVTIAPRQVQILVAQA